MIFFLTFLKQKSDDQELKCGSCDGANDSERELLLGKKSMMELGDKEDDLKQVNTSMGQGADEKEILRTNETSAQTSNEEIKEKNILQENPRTNPNNYFKGQHLKDKGKMKLCVKTSFTIGPNVCFQSKCLTLICLKINCQIFFFIFI